MKYTLYKNNYENKKNYKRGDVVFGKDIEFDQCPGKKSRPLIYLGRKGNVAECMKCTTKFKLYRPLYKIIDLWGAGLDKTSYVDTETIISVPMSKLIAYRGRLSKEDMLNLGI